MAKPRAITGQKHRLPRCSIVMGLVASLVFGSILVLSYRRPAVPVGKDRASAAAISFTALSEENSGEADQDKKNQDEANLGISIMLLGSICFIMALFYIVNHNDSDFRQYSWQVVSATISIFSAVLTFQGINGVVEYYILEAATDHFGDHAKVVVGLSHMFIWFLILQILLAHVSGALQFCKCLKRKTEEEQVDEELAKEKEKEELEEIERNLKCFAVLCGHITGFAAIGGWGELQQMYSKDLGISFALVFAPVIALPVLYKIFDVIRERLMLSDDGKKDEKEIMWDEETEETENDVMGLCVSMLMVQWLRFAVGGALPNVEGEDETKGFQDQTYLQAGMLFGCGILFIALLVARTALLPRMGRLTDYTECIVSMIFAWCFMFSGEWTVNRLLANTEMGTGIMKEVTLSLCISTFAITCIFFLDKMADSDKTGKEVDKSLRALVQPLGILIGFTWEKSFDTAVADVTSLNPTPLPAPILKMLLSFTLAATVIPAWRWYILPTMLEFEAVEKEAEKREEEEEEEGQEYKKLGNGPKAFKEKDVVGLNLGALKREIRGAQLQLKRAARDKHAHIEAHSVHESRIDVLQQRNQVLEQAIEGFSQEIVELQRLADVLIS